MPGTRLSAGSMIAHNTCHSVSSFCIGNNKRVALATANPISSSEPFLACVLGCLGFPAAPHQRHATTSSGILSVCQTVLADVHAADGQNRGEDTAAAPTRRPMCAAAGTVNRRNPAQDIVWAHRQRVTGLNLQINQHAPPSMLRPLADTPRRRHYRQVWWSCPVCVGTS